ncbi:hypothetical protein Ahia01_000156400 [Argonauta hians]
MNTVLRASQNFHQNFTSIIDGILKKTWVFSSTTNQAVLRTLSSKSTSCHSHSAKNANVVSNGLITSPTCPLVCKTNIFPIQPAIGLFWQQNRTYKMKLHPKLRCKDCFFVYRHNRLYVECKVKPRHKQMEFRTKDQLWKEDYSKGNIKTATFWNWSKESWYRRGDNKWSRFDWLQGKYD